MIEWLSYAGAGVIAGLLAGLFGVGGGLIIVPILLIVFSWHQMPAELAMHVAVGTSLMTICVTSLSSISAHQRHGNIRWPLVRLLVIGLMLGSLLGAVIATSISADWLKKLFAVFAILMAIRLWLPQPSAYSNKLLNKSIISGYGVFSGIISAMVGIGGGSLIVPYLLMAGEKAKQAVATSAACGFPIALSGVVGFLLMGTQVHHVQGEGLIGFLHWQAFLGIICTSVFMAPVGAKLSNLLPAHWLRRMLSILLLTIGVLFLLRA